MIESERKASFRRKTEAERIDDLRVRFLHIYPNLPPAERFLPCIVLKIGGNREPLSWHLCYAEVCNKTKLGERILKWLGDMEFI